MFGLNRVHKFLTPLKVFLRGSLKLIFKNLSIMRTIAEYKMTLCSQEPNSLIINKKAIEEGHTKDADIYSEDGFDSVWNDAQGNEVTSGYRLTKDRKNRVLITVVNSFKKDIKDKQTKQLSINND